MKCKAITSNTKRRCTQNATIDGYCTLHYIRDKYHKKERN